MYAVLSTEVLPQLIPPNSKILAAVSGGPDSVALGHILWRYVRENPDQDLSLVVSHVNHRARKEAGQEAELVKMLALQWQAPFILHEFDSKEYASKCQKSFQEAAREWRYARWQGDMEKYGCNLLATAHHLGDQAETVLYRLIRGSGTAGLAGIYPAKDKIIRPLLAVSKKEILQYCLRQGLPYALDKSNFEPLYDRNRIRLELLPEIQRKYNERIQEALGRTAELLRWDEEYLSSQVERVWPEYCRYTDQGHLIMAYQAWEQPEAVLSRLLRRAAALVSGEPRGIEYKFIKLLMKEGRKIGWRQDLPDMQVEAARNGFVFLRKELDQEGRSWQREEPPLDWEIPLTLGKWHPLPALGLQVGIFNRLADGPDILWWTELDQKKVLESKKLLICRLRRPGDRMYFTKIGHKSIKKVFQENHIQGSQRERLPFFVQDQLVIWIPGICRSDSFLPANEHSSKLYGIVSKYKG